MTRTEPTGQSDAGGEDRLAREGRGGLGPPRPGAGARMRRIPNAVTASLLSAALVACTPRGEDPTSASLTALTERPNDFSGRTVAVSGFMAVSWEGGGVFRTASHEQSFAMEHGVFLRIPTKKLGPLEEYDGTYGTLRGVFESDQSHGWRGTITVDRIYPWYRFRVPFEPQRVDFDGDPRERLREEVERSLRLGPR